MKRHLRLWSVFMTAFLIVGLFAGMASAAGVTADKNTVSVQVGKTATITLTNDSNSAATIKGTLSSGADDYFEHDIPSSGVSVPKKNNGENGTATVTITGIAAGEGTLTLKNGTTKVAEISVTVKAASSGGGGDTATAPKFSKDSTKDGADLGKAYDSINKGFFSGATVTVDADNPFLSLEVESGGGDKLEISATFKPDIKELADLFEANNDDGTFVVKGGTVPAVTKDTTVTMTVTAKDSAGKDSRKYTFTIFALPSFTDKFEGEGDSKVATAGSNIVWGSEKAWTFTPKTSNATAVEIAEGGDLEAAAFTEGDDYIGVDFKKGVFSIKKSWMPGRAAQGYFFGDGWDGKTVSKTVKLVAYRGKASDQIKVDDESSYAVKTEATYELKFDGAAPKFSHVDDKYFAFDYSKGAIPGDDDYGKDAYIEVIGPGTITLAEDSKSKVTLDDYELELGAAVAKDDGTGFTYAITGTPKLATKGTKLALLATNEYTGTDKPVKGGPKLVISTNTVEFDAASAVAFTGMSGNLAVGEDTEWELTATPGPIKWSAKNLPAGMKLTADRDDSTKATVTVKLTTATKDPLTDSDKHTWTITATNADFSTAKAEASREAIVWAVPEFKTSDKKPLSAKTGEKGIKFSITTANPVKNWKIAVGDAAEAVNVNAWEGYSIPAGTGTSAGTSKMIIDAEASAKKPNTLVFTGAFDRVPDANIPLKVYATVPLKNGEELTTTVEAAYEIAVTGVAPKFDKNDFEFKNSAGEQGVVKLKGGDPDVKWKAYIDGKTVAKLRGEKTADDIVLYTAGETTDGEATNEYGLSFAPKGDDGDNSREGTLTWEGKEGADVALKKLPVTFEVWNPNINPEKHTTGKATVTIAGDAPAWKYTYVNEDQGIESTDQAVDDKTNKLELNTKAGEDFTGLTVNASGSGPLTYSVKPETKNGITATLGEGENAGTVTVTFSGTADSVTKDTAVKFTLEAKNPSTGVSAKAAITFNILPTPAGKDDAAYTIEAKPVTVGKDAKVAPKLAATNKSIEWEVTSVKLGEDDALLADYGLSLSDKAKGVISGTTKKATGKDVPLTITMVAHGPLAESAPFTVTIPIVGEKVKLDKQDKPVTFTLDDEGAPGEPANAQLKTTLKNEDGKVSIEWAVDAEKVKEADDLFTLTRGEDNGVTATVGLKEDAKLKVAKKISIPVKFTNYGTESTGKFTVVVEGAKPVIDGDSTVTVDADNTATATLRASNKAGLSDKLKWKIDTKPTTKGLSVSIKDNKDGTATLTVKAGKAVTTGGSAKIKLTDSVTKKDSELWVVDIDVNAADDNESTLEATDNTTAKETEAKVIGEGTVTMHGQRTVANLTAGQRAQIEAQGYVIAAVLPEIEVDADGQYDFEVELDADEKVKAGAELVWFAFASKPTTDDEIVDFEDLEGNEIKVVPEIAEGHEYPVVVAWPWLNEGTKYAPVIAVKANADEADAMTEDGVKEKAEEAKEEK